MNEQLKLWTRWVGIKSLGRKELLRVVRSGSAMNLRALLALAATTYAVLTLWAPTYSWRDPSTIVKDHTPSLSLWAAMFGLDAFCLWWRILDSTPRIWWARLINVYTFALWFSLVGVTASTLGYLSPDSTGELILCVMAAWTAFRIDSTPLDKETA